MCVFSAELIIRVPLCVWFLQTQSPEEERELWCSQAVVVAFSEVVRSDPADPNAWDVLGTQEIWALHVGELLGVILLVNLRRIQAGLGWGGL